MKAKLDAFATFLKEEAGGGVVLMGATIAALIWANSPFKGSYQAVWQARLFGISVSHGINDGLMALFFLVAGLEIRYEFSSGDLSSWRKAALPVAAALGGMVGPALIYASLNAGTPGAGGWGIPTATDIAFAVGIMALLGSRVSRALKIFLVSLAIADDIGAVLVIALFYSGGISAAWAAAAACCVGAMAALRLRTRVGLWAYAVLGICLWYAMLRSGIHATLAGVALAMLIPDHPREGESTIKSAMSAFHPWTTYGIVPLFALANAGVDLSGASLSWLGHPVAAGTALGLALGKPLGITLASWLAVKVGLGERPAGISWLQLHGASWIAGTGFTMSLFIAGLAFSDPRLFDLAKVGILAAAVAAAGVGSAVLLLAPVKDQASR